MIPNILSILFVIFIIWGIDKHLKAMRKEAPKGQSPQMIAGDFYRELFRKLAKIRPESELELFLIARTEMSFGYGDHIVEQHYEKWLETQDLPNYVEAFVEKGKKQILEA